MKKKKNDFYELYSAVCKSYRDELDEQVKNGEISEDDAYWSYFMGKDDILYDMMLREEENKGGKI